MFGLCMSWTKASHHFFSVSIYLFHTPWQEYAGAGLDKKRSILQKIEQHGAKNCNWVHQLSNKTTAVDSTEEEVSTNFLTRPAFHFLGKSYAFFLKCVCQGQDL